MRRILLKRLLRNASGATIIEFAIIAPIFFIVMLATIEFGLYLFTYVTLESAVTLSARTASINSGLQPDIVGFVTQDVRARARWIPTSQEINISANRVAGGGTLPPDICDVNGVVTTNCNCGNTYIEVNNEPGCQTAAQVQLGGSNELIEIRASLPWRVHLPLISEFFVSTDADGNRRTGIAMITVTAVVQNEPSFPNPPNPPGGTYGECCEPPDLDYPCILHPEACEGGGGGSPPTD